MPSIVTDKFASIRNKGRYRIQSVDFETYLERRGETLVLRPLKITSENQEWVFVKQPEKDNIYEIEPVSSKRILIGQDTNGECSLFLEEKPIEIERGTKTGTSWTLYTASAFNDQLYIVNNDLRDSKRVKSYLVYVDRKGDTTFNADLRVQSDQNFQMLSMGENYLWRLIEVTPTCLPSGNLNDEYRIRTLNGMVIHSVPNRESLSIKNQSRGPQRAWTIQDLGNGNVTLYNTGAKKYLATKLIDDTWEPVLSERAPLALESTGSTREEEDVKSPYRIEEISEVCWSICIWRKSNRFRGRDQLSLSLKDDTVILKPWKKAHNQLWMIEATDAPVPADNKLPDDDEISAGFSIKLNKQYEFRRNDGLGGIRMVYNSAVNPNRFEATFDINSGFTPSQLTMERNPTGQDGDVFIYRSLSGKRYLNLSGSQVTVVENPYSWTIEQAQNSAYFLIRDTKSKLYISHNSRTGPLTVKSQSGANDTTTFWSLVPFNK